MTCEATAPLPRHPPDPTLPSSETMGDEDCGMDPIYSCSLQLMLKAFRWWRSYFLVVTHGFRMCLLVP